MGGAPLVSDGPVCARKSCLHGHMQCSCISRAPLPPWRLGRLPFNISFMPSWLVRGSVPSPHGHAGRCCGPLRTGIGPRDTPAQDENLRCRPVVRRYVLHMFLPRRASTIRCAFTSGVPGSICCPQVQVTGLSPTPKPRCCTYVYEDRHGPRPPCDEQLYATPRQSVLGGSAAFAQCYNEPNMF